ncbi:hypothetical protein [Streptomyces sp. ICBB 8177]|uniref:hypothetical protein n=1 Tax=Streptomyces sp. ICBB 8177 TaxID=563922 RepID=UPI000D684150|nr:hypothetical protein [Streptomyces sp. ICBB 8177]PWI46164.1 hypothetical protein CK485_02695 [Streptomyces sp. ICBB 8177]
MSSVTIVTLLVAAAAVAVGSIALLAVRGLHRQVVALRGELAEHRADVADLVTAASAGLVPGARPAPQGEEIRTAVAEALADERERELAEARAFWAAQEAREAADAPVLDGVGPEFTDFAEYEAMPFLPRPVDFPLSLPDLTDTPDAAPRSRRHPSDPDFVPVPAVADPEQTVARLAELAEAATPLADVRPGPLGTLDLYVFADGTTLCLTPGHRETAERLVDALERGQAPVLLGGSGVSGGYALTFTYGEESVFILADRVVTSL